MSRHFFHFGRASFLRCEANLSQTSRSSFPSRLFKETFPQSCHVCPFGRYFKTLFALAFLFRTFFFAFSSRCELSPRRGIPYSYRAHISLYIFLFKVAQKSFSHHAGARKERLRACCFWDVVIHLSSRVGGVFFYEDDRLKFRAIISRWTFLTQFDRLFSLSRASLLSKAKSSARKADLLLTDAVFFFSFSLFKCSFIPYQY